MPQVFPDSVKFVQKFTQKTLYLMRSLLHTDAFHHKSHFYAGRGLVSIQKLCCSRGGRRKKAVGGENYPWAFSNSWSEVHYFASKSEASMTRGRLRLTATTGAALPNILPDLIPAQLGSISHGLTISCSAPAPQPQRQPWLPPALSRAVTGITPAVFPVLS